MMGRKHRPFFRLCAMDGRTPRDGRVLEELGIYDPLVSETDARAVLNGERIAYWLSVGAQPSDKAVVLIKKYGKDGTHLEEQKAAMERLAQQRRRGIAVSDIPAATPRPKKVKSEKAEGPAATPAPEAADAAEPVVEVVEAVVETVVETPAETPAQ